MSLDYLNLVARILVVYLEKVGKFEFEIEFGIEFELNLGYCVLTTIAKYQHFFCPIHESSQEREFLLPELRFNKSWTVVVIHYYT